jgi:hypothetical protein
MGKGSQPTLCWDCAKATGGCRWSDQFQPIEGWTAVPTLTDKLYESYIVIDCPEFKRDGMNLGAKRYKPNDPLNKAVKGGIKAIYGSNDE